MEVDKRLHNREYRVLPTAVVCPAGASLAQAPNSEAPFTAARPSNRRSCTTGSCNFPKMIPCRRMEASRARSGSTLLATSATGKRTRRTDSAFSSTRTETNTRDSGRETSVTAKALTGATRLASSEESIQETGLKTRSTVEGLSSIRTVTGTTVIGSPACLRVKVE